MTGPRFVEIDGRRIVTHTPSGKLASHGGSGSTYTNHGCRCEECCAANTARCKHAREQRIRDHDARADDFTHGARGYSNWGCRCEACSTAWSKELKMRQARRLARPEDTPHGTISGYKSWRCRCDACKAAISHWGRVRYLLQKAGKL